MLRQLSVKVFKNIIIKNLFFVMFFLVYVTYLYWRGRYTLPFHEGFLPIFFGIFLFIAEIVGFLDTIIFYFLVLSNGNEENLDTSSINIENYPHIDVFIATYNEEEELLYKTVIGCLNMKYPDKDKVHIYICDDGKRENIKNMCENLKINYISRNDNLHAKAGNINNALKITKSPYVVTFDADMIPTSDFLMVTIPHFILDEKMGFVQLPQSFYNSDLFQYNLYTENTSPNEQDFFFRLIQPGKSKHNAVIYAGSNTVLSRKALMEIGGIVTGTITEDFVTGMKLQSLGYKSKYINEVHASGLSPESMEALYNQRIRWGRGVIQTIKQYNPFRMKGLSFIQKILYFNSFFYWYFGLWRLIFLLAPIIFTVFNIIVLKANAFQMLVIWIPLMIFTRISYSYFSKNIRSVSWSNVYDTILFYPILIGTLKETFGFKMSKFEVTPKNIVHKENFIYNFKIMKIQIILAILSFIGIIKIAYLYLINQYESQYTINLLWLLYNFYLLIMAIFFASERPKFRNHERIPIKETVVVENNNQCYKGVSFDLAETGISLLLDSPIYFSQDERYNIKVITEKYNSSLEAKFLRVDSYNDLYKYIFTVTPINIEDKNNLILILHDRVPYFPQKQSKHNMIQNIIKNLKKRREKIISMNRKSPRILIEKTVVALVEGKEININIHDYNYNYITSIDKINSGNFKICLKNNFFLECVYESDISIKNKNNLYLYKILNFEPRIDYSHF